MMPVVEVPAARARRIYPGQIAIGIVIGVVGTLIVLRVVFGLFLANGSDGFISFAV